jgi:hypothetical protein
MLHEIERSSLDLRYEDRRLKNRVREGRLLSSIAERGIDEPLEGVSTDGAHVLLNGFKRYRCAVKLGMGTVPYVLLGEDAAMGIVALLRTSDTTSLSILEQAGFIDELQSLQTLSLAEIAELLSRSKAWVSMRVGLLGEMTDTIRRKLFSGAFSVYSYLYTVRRFMRMNALQQARSRGVCGGAQRQALERAGARAACPWILSRARLVPGTDPSRQPHPSLGADPAGPRGSRWVQPLRVWGAQGS